MHRHKYTARDIQAEQNEAQPGIVDWRRQRHGKEISQETCLLADILMADTYTGRGLTGTDNFRHRKSLDLYIAVGKHICITRGSQSNVR